MYIFLISITSRVDLAMSVCPYERWDLGNYESYNSEIRYADSWDSCAAQVSFRRVPRPQTAHKIEKIVNMNADISETIEDRELGFQI